MDKPKSPAGPNDPQSPWPANSGSEQDFGASGVFQVVKPTEPAEGLPTGSSSEFGAPGVRAAETAKPQPGWGAKPLEEPVVHKVVFGGGAPDNSSELLNRMRMESAERSSAPSSAPTAPSGGTGSGGFTELLRTLGTDPPLPAAAKGTPASETRAPAQNSGFTSLLRTLSPSDQPVTSAGEPAKVGQPAFGTTPSIPQGPSPYEQSNVPPPSAPGSFTQLLRAAPGDVPASNTPQMYRAGPGEAPVASGTPGTIPAPSENKPGAFTQLFSTLSSAEPGSSAPPPSGRPTGDSSGGGAGSFTQMLSLEPQRTPADLPRYEENKPAAGSVNYGVTPAAGIPAPQAGTGRDPFSPSSLPEAQPAPGTSQGSGVGITRLIQMLDEPSKAPIPRREEAPMPPPQGTGPGVWTQTFASLATPTEPVAPAAKAPDWAAPPQAPPAASGFPASSPAYPPANLNAPPAYAPPAPPVASGPSEFTRILDASRIRESAMRGGQIPAAESPVPAPPPAAPRPPAAMQMPHPGVYPPPPPQVPVYPVNYGAHPGSMPAAGGGMPQHPAMYAPPPPAIPAPQVPPPKPAQPPVGKLQQLVPVLLIVVIVLLVAILVTVIFLMKH